MFDTSGCKRAATEWLNLYEAGKISFAYKQHQAKEKIMGTFFVRCKIENLVNREQAAVLPRMLVDTGSEYTWVPANKLEKIGISREKKTWNS